MALRSSIFAAAANHNNFFCMCDFMGKNDGFVVVFFMADR
jgi:hypothetical protein